MIIGQCDLFMSQDSKLNDSIQLPIKSTNLQMWWKPPSRPFLGNKHQTKQM